MSHKITARTALLVRELGMLAKQINDPLLTAASWEARDEWSALRRRWPSEAHLRLGALPVSDDELYVMVGKVRRFKAILEALKARPAHDAAAPAFAAAA